MIGNAARLCSALAIATLFLNLSAPAAEAVDRGFAAIGGQVQPTTDTDLGAFTNAHMAIEVVLAPSNASGLSNLLTDLYEASGRHLARILQSRYEFLTQLSRGSGDSLECKQPQ
jgi:hypothetical protein